MKLIVGNRGSGKTNEIIKQAYNLKGIIVTFSQENVDYILATAKWLKLDIRKPITWDEYLSSHEQDKYLIDNIDKCLCCHGCVVMASSSVESLDDILITNHQNRTFSKDNLYTIASKKLL